LRALIGVAGAVLLAVLIYLANVAWWIDREIVQPDNFVESSVEALGSDSSREALARLIVDRLTDEYPLLALLDSTLVGLFSDLLDSSGLEEVLVVVSADIHHRIILGNQEAIVVDLLEHRDLILGPVEFVAPRLAALVPDEWFTSIELLEEGALPDLSLYARLVGPVRIVSITGIVLLVISMLWFLRRRGVGLMAVGAAFGLASIATAVLVPGGKVAALARVDQKPLEIIAADTYDQFASSLKLSAVLLALTCAALALVGYALWSASDAETH
jgi:hypothetical protein